MLLEYKQNTLARLARLTGEYPQTLYEWMNNGCLTRPNIQIGKRFVWDTETYNQIIKDIKALRRKREENK